MLSGAGLPIPHHSEQTRGTRAKLARLPGPGLAQLHGKSQASPSRPSSRPDHLHVHFPTHRRQEARPGAASVGGRSDFNLQECWRMRGTGQRAGGTSRCMGTHRPESRADRSEPPSGEDQAWSPGGGAPQNTADWGGKLSMPRGGQSGQRRGGPRAPAWGRCLFHSAVCTGHRSGTRPSAQAGTCPGRTKTSRTLQSGYLRGWGWVGRLLRGQEREPR